MSLLKDVFIVLRGSLFAQLLGVMALPILARMYNPEAFGRYQVFLSILSFLVLSASLRYELPILNVDTDERALALVQLCIVINVLMSVCTLILCAVLYIIFPAWAAKLGSSLWFLPPALLAGGLFQTTTYLLLRSRALKESAAAKVVQSLGYCSVSVCLGALKLIGVGLIIADLAAKSFALSYALGKISTRSDIHGIWRRQGQSYLSLLRTFRDYPLIALPGSLLNNIGGILTPILLFENFGAGISGQYSLVERSIALPIGLVSQAVAQAYIATFSASLRSNPTEAAAVFKTVVATLFKIGVIPTIALMVFGREFFSFVFGSGWSASGEFSRILAPMLFASFLVAPVDMTLQILNKQTINFLWQVSRLALVVSGWAIVSGERLDAMTAMRLISIISTVAYLALLLIIYRNVLSSVAPRGATT